MYVVRTSCGSHAGSCGQKQSPAKGRSRSLRWPQGNPPAAPSLGWRGDGASRAEPSQAGCRRNGRPRALSVRSVFLGRHRLPSLKIPVFDKALRRRRHPRAGAADRAGSKFFKAVQSGSKFEVRAFKVCANFSNFAPPEAQEHRLSSDFLEQPRTPLRNAALPRR